MGDQKYLSSVGMGEQPSAHHVSRAEKMSGAKRPSEQVTLIVPNWEPSGLLLLLRELIN